MWGINPRESHRSLFPTQRSTEQQEILLLSKTSLKQKLRPVHNKDNLVFQSIIQATFFLKQFTYKEEKENGF